MEIFTTKLVNELLSGFLAGFLPAWELRGIFAAEVLKLIVLLFREFSITSCVVALGWVAVFGKSKGLILSGISHLLGLAELLINLFGMILSWRKT